MNIEDGNIKWLEYMNNVDVNKVTKCPNGHDLRGYHTDDNTEIVITCPHGGLGLGVDMCDYYDYHTFSVPVDSKSVSSGTTCRTQAEPFHSYTSGSAPVCGISKRASAGAWKTQSETELT